MKKLLEARLLLPPIKSPDQLDYFERLRDGFREGSEGVKEVRRRKLEELERGRRGA